MFRELEFVVKAELVYRKVVALEARGVAFAGRDQVPVSLLSKEKLAGLSELRGVCDFGDRLIKKSIGRLADTNVPGTRFTLNKFERIAQYANDAFDAMGDIQKKTSPGKTDEIHATERKSKTKTTPNTSRPKLQTALQTAMRETDAPKASDIIAARRALGQARRNGFNGADARAVSKLIDQLALALDVTEGFDELTDLKELTASLMNSVAQKDVDAALGFQALAKEIDAALVQAREH